MEMVLFGFVTIVVAFTIVAIILKNVKKVNSTEVHIGVHENLGNEKLKKIEEDPMVTSFKEELEKAQQKLQKDNEREDALKAERLKIEQAKRQRQAELSRRERQTHGSGITSPTSYETPYVASEPSYNSGDSCSSSSSSSSYDSGSSSSSSSSSSDSGSSSYSSCD